jgi:hypothetical protein
MLYVLLVHLSKKGLRRKLDMSSSEHRAWIDRTVVDKSLAKAASDHTASKYRLVEVDDSHVQRMLKYAAAGVKRDRDAGNILLTNGDHTPNKNGGGKTACFQFKGDGREIVVVGGGEATAVGVRRIEYSNSLFLIDKNCTIPTESEPHACVVVNESYTFELHATRSKVESIRALLPARLAIAPDEADAVQTGASTTPSRSQAAALTFEEIVQQSMCSEEEVATFLIQCGVLMIASPDGTTKPRVPQRLWFLQVLEAVLVFWNGRRGGGGSVDDNDCDDTAVVDRELILSELGSAYPVSLIEAVITALAEKKESQPSTTVSFGPTPKMVAALSEHIFLLASLITTLTTLEDADSEAANDTPAASHYVAPLTRLTVQALQVLQAAFNAAPVPPLVDPRECLDRNIHSSDSILPGFGGSSGQEHAPSLTTIELPLSSFLAHFRRHIRERCGRTWLLTTTAASTPATEAPATPTSEVTELSDEDILDTWLAGTVYVKEAGPASTIGFLEEWRLPARLTGRIAMMFAVKPKWRLWELRGYIRPVLEEGQTLDWAIGKYCKENKLSTGKWQEYTAA